MPYPPIPPLARQFNVGKVRTIEAMTIVEVPVPRPRATEVLVKVKAVSLQYRDMMIIMGRYPLPYAATTVPCSDGVGEIAAVGEEVTGWQVGDRVMPNFFLDLMSENVKTDEIMNSAMGAVMPGMLQEYRVLPARSLVKIPDHLSYEEAATLPCAGLTAYAPLLDGPYRIQAGETILIQGTGGIATFALQFASVAGAVPIVISSSDEKLEQAKAIGARYTINYKTTPDWDRVVKEITHGRGCDRVLELTGNLTLQRSINAVKLGGLIDIIGLLGGRMSTTSVPDVDAIVPAIFKQIIFRGVYVGSVEQFERFARFLAAHPETTRPKIDKSFPFEEAPEAFKHMWGKTHVGKIVVRVNEDCASVPGAWMGGW
ncbi:Alcohol dehydrogenase superfamily protein [Mycena chlorophos]|uniref:Alcohol dehydrogenase superfamily protein n=1 Tax=Mycena chlorophos TaxID=658473 RepID=A0A8H6VXG6_MYCCL|nr:Alcohol dehydrogenase superfamily protein [Mycena chlorophos]